RHLRFGGHLELFRPEHASERIPATVVVEAASEHGMKWRPRTLAVEIATVIGLSSLLFFYGLGSFGLVGADEPRYAQVARETLRTTEFVHAILCRDQWVFAGRFD